MKLLNKSLAYLTVSLLVIIGLWSVVFYYNFLDEIKKSVDEGLDNFKRQIIYKIERDPSILKGSDFSNSFFSIHEISSQDALKMRDHYSDSVLYMQDANDFYPESEPVRILTTAFEKDNKYYELRIAYSMVEQNDLIRHFFNGTLLLYLLLMASIFLINNAVLQKLWKPFYSYLRKLKAYHVGINKEVPKEKTNVREFNDLQRAVNVLLYSNIEIYDQQKQFIGNAAHELQTPLAIAENKLELLIEKGNLTSGDAESIAEIMNILERLIRLNKSLLLLSKIESRQFLDNQPVLINRVIQQSREDLKEIIEFRAIDFNIEEKAGLTIRIDPALAQILISNLARNAIFHNVNGGRVDAFVDAKVFRISNTGVKEAADKELIFSRFYKTESNPNSTGLGLSMVKAICTIYNISLSYQFENGLHVFTLQF